MKRILLAVITEGDSCVAHFCSSLTQSVKVGLYNEVDFCPVFLSVNDAWSMAFNHGLTLAHEGKFDGFITISSKVFWEPEALLELAQTDKDVVAIPVIGRRGFDIQLGEIARLQDDEATGEIKIQGCGVEMLYMSAYAMGRLYETNPEVSYHGQPVRLVTQLGDQYKTYYTPQSILLHRLTEQQIEIWANPKHTARRIESADTAGNFAEYLQQLRDNG